MPGTIEIEMRFETDDGVTDPALFEQFLDDVVDEFAKLGADVDYTAVASEMKATWTIDVPDASEGSLIDADMGAWYTWLNQQRLSGAEKSSFLVWFEGHGEAMAIGPSYTRGTESATPTDLEQLIEQIG